jgi:two-component sensor histidine kinase
MPDRKQRERVGGGTLLPPPIGCAGGSLVTAEGNAMEEKLKALRAIVHQISNDLSGVKAMVDLAAMGLKKDLDVAKVKAGVDKINQSLSQLKEVLRSD